MPETPPSYRLPGLEDLDSSPPESTPPEEDETLTVRSRDGGKVLPIVPLMAEALRRNSVSILDVKPSALLVEVAGKKYVVGVRECE